MDWNKLKSFYLVALCKSISKASKKLNISQSAISRQIQDLEFDLKTSLFMRHQKEVTLTEQGENLYNTIHNKGPSYQTYFVYTEAFKNDRRLEVFRDFLFSEAKDWNY